MKIDRSLKFGVSFSLKQSRGFGTDPKDTLSFLIKEMGLKRFRLMSYWDEHEKAPGNYDFKELDWQFKMIESAGGAITLCIGARQPRCTRSNRAGRTNEPATPAPRRAGRWNRASRWGQ